MVSDRISLDHREGMILCGETNFRLSSSPWRAIMQRGALTHTYTHTGQVDKG